MNNPILDELHAIREQQLADAGGTLEGLVVKVQADQRASDRTIRKSRASSQGTESSESAKSAQVAAENQPLPHGER